MQMQNAPYVNYWAITQGPHERARNQHGNQSFWAGFDERLSLRDGHTSDSKNCAGTTFQPISQQPVSTRRTQVAFRPIDQQLRTKGESNPTTRPRRHRVRPRRCTTPPPESDTEEDTPVAVAGRGTHVTGLHPISVAVVATVMGAVGSYLWTMVA